MIEVAQEKDLEMLKATPPEMRMNLYAPTDYAFKINDDLDWLRARLLLGSIFRKYGPFAVDITRKKDK